MIKPLNDYVVIRRAPEVAKKGSIVIPDVAQEKSLIGIIAAIGPKVEEVKVGDKVYFASKWNDLAGTHYHTESPAHFDQSLHLVQEKDIFLLVNA